MWLTLIPFRCYFLMKLFVYRSFTYYYFIVKMKDYIGLFCHEYLPVVVHTSYCLTPYSDYILIDNVIRFRHSFFSKYAWLTAISLKIISLVASLNKVLSFFFPLSKILLLLVFIFRVCLLLAGTSLIWGYLK